MSKEEAINYLQQLYPNGGHCWLDEQRIEAIGMAVKALQEEPVSEDLGEITLEGTNFNKSWYAHPELAFKAGEFRGRQFGVPVSEDLKKTAKQYSFYIPTQCEATETWKKETEQHFIDGAKWQLAKIKSITLDDLEKFINELSKQFPEVSFAKVCKIAARTAKWQKEHLWKSADGDDLPEIGREVVAFQADFPNLFRIVVAHRPNPEGYDGKSIATGVVEHYTPKTYDKGGWNIPNVKYWLDCQIPNMVED